MGAENTTAQNYMKIGVFSSAYNKNRFLQRKDNVFACISDSQEGKVFEQRFGTPTSELTKLRDIMIEYGFAGKLKLVVSLRKEGEAYAPP